MYFIYKHHIGTYLTVLLFFIVGAVSTGVAALDTENAHGYSISDYLYSPEMSETNNQKNLLLHIDQSSDMLARAYRSKVFNGHHSEGREGYFDASKQYQYNLKEQYFEENSALSRGESNAWDGQFLNWLLMRKLDMTKLLLLGVHPQDSANVISLASNSFEAEQLITASESRRYSPIPNFVPIKINQGVLQFQKESFKLRVKLVQNQKGLSDAVMPSIALYFYANKSIITNTETKNVLTFGEGKKALASFLEHWQPHYAILSSRAYQDAYTDAFQRVLKKIAKLNSANQNSMQCQRYAHVELPHAVHGPILFAPHLLQDCQVELTGKQALAHYQWQDRHDQQDAKSTAHFVSSDFSYSQKYHLFKSLFNHLFSAEQDSAYNVTGADLQQFSDGVSALYQSLSRYTLGQYTDQINWVGDLRASLMDDQGFLRSDNGDKTLGSVNEDPYVSSCFDVQENLPRFRFSSTPLPKENCNRLHYPYSDDDIGYLWRASDHLSSLSTAQRHIRTHIGQKEYRFEAGEDYPLDPESLGLSSQKELHLLINYVRGEAQEGDRNRQLNGKDFLLGDAFNSAPIAVGKPVSNHHILSGDKSYQAFIDQYQSRRTRIFSGRNDGMLHSVNGGWYDAHSKQLNSAPPHAKQRVLGQETWAFLPEAVVPYLTALRDPLYGISPEHHFSLFLHAPYVFDAKVFGVNQLKGQADRIFRDNNGAQVSQQTHPNGWGTLMVVGLGTFQPSYLVFDITDSEQAPKFLSSIQASDMGRSISLPSVMTQENSQGELDWYLVIGSGTDASPAGAKMLASTRTAALYTYNLKQLATHAYTQRIELGIENAYVTGTSAVDWDVDGSTDALYANTAQIYHDKTGGHTAGGVHRIDISKVPGGTHTLRAEKLFDASLPLHDRPQLSMDRLGNRWVYFSTGQVPQPIVMPEKHTIFGIKVPREGSGRVKKRALLDVSNIVVNASDGVLSGAWTMQTALPENTVKALEMRMMNFSEPSEYIAGWQRQLSEYEIPNGASRLLGGILTQTTYQAHYPHCRLERKASIHHLRFTTGTPWYAERAQINQASQQSAELNTGKTDLDDASMVHTVLFHHKGTHLTRIQSSKNGSLETKQARYHYLPVDGEISWKEL